MFKVLYLDSWGDLAGGGQYSLLDIVQNAERMQVVPKVICGCDGTLVQRLSQEGIAACVIDMPAFRWKQPCKKSIERIRSIIRDEAIDVLHANSMRASLYAIAAAEADRKPVIVHARVLREKCLGDIAYDAYIALRAAMIISNSNTVANRFRFPFRRAKSRVVYNGVDIEALQRASDDGLRNQWAVQPDAVVIGLVGMLDPRKGHGILLEAMPMIRKQCPQAVALFAGEQPKGIENYKALLERKIQALGLVDCVKWPGRVSQVGALMCALDICVLPVVKPEGFGRVVVEAGACAKPVIASGLGGVREIIRHGVTGWMVEPGDPVALAKAVIELIQDAEKRRSMGEAGRVWVTERFSIKRMLDELGECYATCK